MSNPLTRMLSRPTNKPFRTHHINDEEPYLDDEGYVDFAPDDIENPKNWSPKRRWAVTLSAIWLVMNATFASSAPSGCFDSIAESFGVSEVAAGLTITLFLLGYVAGPLVFAPLSEFYGRRWVFYITFALYVIFNFLCAFAPNFGSLLVGRFLTGTFVSAPLSNSPGVLADLWNPLDLGNAMAVFSSVLWAGPALGPVVAGFLELKKDWRWAFYVLLWLGGASAVLMLTIPETHAPTILVKKAKRIRSKKLPGLEDAKAKSEVNGSLVDMYKTALLRPWQLIFDPISFFCALYMSVVYTLLYMLFSIYPIVFQEKRGWNAGVGELPLCGTVVGAATGGVIVFIDTQLRKKRLEKNGKTMADLEPEDRLPLAMIGGIGFAVSMYWFAWTAEFDSVPWIVPTIAGGFLAMSLLLIFVAYLSYIVDTYRMYAASASAANMICRSACGAAAPLFTNQMFKALGVGGGGSLIAGVGTVLAIIPFVFYKYGKKIRQRSRFAPTEEKPKSSNNDEESGNGKKEEARNDREESGSTRSRASSSSGTVQNNEEGKLDQSSSNEKKERGESAPSE